jgi:hypothetical protein
MLVVMQDTSDITLYESPMMHYLAVRGVDELTKKLRPSFCYTPILAGALWINRLIMLEVAIPLEAWPALELQSKAEMVARNKEEKGYIRERLSKLREWHLCEGAFNPTASILSQLAMGKYFNKLHKSTPNIHWSEDEQTIFYEGQPVELAKVQSMCHTLVQELQESMKELAFQGDVPSIDLSRIVDSMSWSQAFQKLNHNFIQHAANKELVGNVDFKYLLERARKRQGGWRLMKKARGSQKMEWVDAQVKKYLTKERQFLRKLMVCMHVTGK